MGDTTAEVTRTRQAREPEDLHRLFAEYGNAGDLDALVGLYEDDAVVVPQPDQVASGRENVRRALGQLLSLGATFTAKATKVFRVGEIALISGTWNATATGPDDNTMTFGGRDAVVARRLGDGTWRMVIDDANFVE